MRRTIALFGWLFGGLIAASIAVAQDINLVDGPDPLADAQWTSRLLVVCSNEDDFLSADFLDAQADEAASDLPGYIARDLILVWINDDRILSLQPMIDETGAAVVSMSEHHGDPTELRARTGCVPASNFVALIGKDGGVKLRDEAMVSNEDLFALIDSMPMRRQEMREQGN